MTNEETIIEHASGDYHEEFTGEPPVAGVKYQVIRDEWLLDRDPPLRIIHEFKIVDTSA